MGSVLELEVQENICPKEREKKRWVSNILTHSTRYYQGHPIVIGQVGVCNKLCRKEKVNFLRSSRLKMKCKICLESTNR